MVLVAVQGRSMYGKSHKEASAIIQSSGRPITMTFVPGPADTAPQRRPTTAPSPAPFLAPTPAPAPASTGYTAAQAAAAAKGLSDVSLWYEWLGVDPDQVCRGPPP
jgi:hypothetical protein